jgi:sortase (surface protein transpeptidase)
MLILCGTKQRKEQVTIVKKVFKGIGLLLSILLLITFVKDFRPNIFAIAYTDLEAEEIASLNQEETTPEEKIECLHEAYYSLMTEMPACDKYGTESFYCDICGELLETKEIPLLEHEFEAMHVDSTCKQEGFEYSRCVNCNEKKDLTTLPVLEHDIKTLTIVQRTCAKGGKEQDKCERCGDIIATRDTEKLEHNYEQTAYKAPLPNEQGYKTVVCKYCNDKQTTTLTFKPKSSNSIYMPRANIHASYVVGPCNQYYTDKYDITVSYDFINATNPVMFGHNTRSLGPMYKVKVGDYIYLTEDGVTTTYKVTHSEIGVDINGSTNIKGVDTGALCIEASSTKTLRIFTCYNSAKYGKCRWMILARPI